MLYLGQSKKITSDSEFSLFRIMVFKKGADTVKNLCRERRFTVRPYEHDPNAEKSEMEKKVILTTERNKLLSALMVWIVNKYSEVFMAWIHLKAIRTFTESVLRFGIPVNFVAAMLKIRRGMHSKLRQTLKDLYSTLSGASLVNTTDESAGADIGGMGGGEFYPYVYIPIDTQDE